MCAFYLLHMLKPCFHGSVCCVLCQRSLTLPPEQLGQWVTWEDMQSALLFENPQEVR